MKNSSYPEYKNDNMATIIRKVRSSEDSETSDDKTCRPVWQVRYTVIYHSLTPFLIIIRL